MKNKWFQELSIEEMMLIPDKEYAGINPFEKRCCSNCKFMVSHVSWWCKNNEAIKSRGTNIPSVVKCIYWYPGMHHDDKNLTRIIKGKNLSHTILPDGTRFNYNTKPMKTCSYCNKEIKPTKEIKGAVVCPKCVKEIERL